MENIPPPPITDLPAPSPTRQPRPYAWIWILVALLFSLMIFTAVAAYLDPKEPLTDKARIEAALRELDTEIQRIELFQALSATPSSFPRKALEEASAQVRTLAQDPERFAALAPRERSKLAEIDFVTSAFLGIPPLKSSLEPVARSPEFRAYGNLPGEKTAQEWRAIASKMPRDRTMGTLARGLALEKAGDPAPFKTERSESQRASVMLMGLGIVGAGGLGLAAWILYLVRRSQGQWAPLGHPAGDLTLPEADTNAIRFILYLLIPLALGSLIFHALGTVIGEWNRIVGVILLIGLTIGIAGQKLSHVDWSAQRVFGPEKFQWKHVGWGLGGFVANIPILAVLLIPVTLLLPHLPQPDHPMNEMIRSGGLTTLGVISLFFMAVLMAPITEEIGFRGFLAPALGRVLGSVVWGMILNGFLFAAIHPQGPLLWMILGWIGVMGALLTYQTKSLYPAIIMHAVHNGVVLFFSLRMTQ
ncbi:MAG TPA: type II CAAX endopeptidase family protein [Fimbriimonadaceae bacterium]|nr:type II CAAX endopeptidase family protein [Fimbriimonadaceae bacterium]HRJ32414.1 type II CAAX endopeptidase family protein [Fimbriimonadaceae bacterium]